MENLKEQIQRLLHKSEWTHEEKTWLLAYLEESEAEELRELLRMQFQREQHEKAGTSSLPDDALEAIHGRIGIQKKRVAVVTKRLTGSRIMAAAAVIGLLFLGAYFLLTKETTPTLAKESRKEQIRQNDVQPGAANAVLTLADGSTLVLTDEGNGELVQQGGTKVLKIDGRLTYTPLSPETGTSLFNTITTPRGGQYQVILADGSAVWLNAASSLRFPTAFTGKERRVEITGEAYFEVAKKGGMPFVVSVNGAEVQVLGTHFNIMAYEDEAAVKTTLLEGAVKFIKGDRAVTLKPGQQAQLKKSGGINVQNGIDGDKIISWKKGYFDFDGADIQTVTKQLARWYDIEVDITGQIEDRFYAEIPRSTKLSDALRALALTGKVHFRLAGRKVVVTP